MAKILLWIVVIFVILFVWRLVNAGKARDRRRQAGEDAKTQAMVRCVRCGTYVPRADAKQGRIGLTCGDPACVSR
ncbi:MAG: PP0621 family protein [Casimicrobiaceae bacterium]